MTLTLQNFSEGFNRFALHTHFLLQCKTCDFTSIVVIIHTFSLQVNFGRHFYNIVKMVEDVLVELLATIRHHQNGKEYTAKLGAMKNSSLPKVSGM